MSVDAVLLDIAPEMDAVDAALRTRIIDLAKLRVSEKVFGELTELATAYLAAHMLTMRTRSGAGGAVSSESEGSLSRSYTASSDKSLLASTSYGQEYIALRNTFVVPVISGYGNG